MKQLLAPIIPSFVCALCIIGAQQNQTGTINLRIIDKDTAQLVPCRIHLANAKGKPLQTPRCSMTLVELGRC